jgi:multidrug efflux pump subunit AcrA (membrane-fusion protein)
MIYPSEITPAPPRSIEPISIENLPIVKSEEFLPRISRWTSLGGLLMMATVGLSLFLAGVTKYRVTVASAGIIRPTGELRLVQTAIAGEVLQILGKENQIVKKGDVIATIDNSEVKTKQDRLEIKIQQVQPQLTQFDTQIQQIDRQILAEIERYKISMAADRGKLILSQRNYQDKQITTTAAVREAEANIRSAQNERQKAQAQLKSIQADLRSTQASLQSAFAKQSRYQKVAKLGAISQDQFEEAKLAYQQQEQKVQAQKGTIEAQQQTIAQLQQNVLAAQAKLESLKANLNPTNAEIAIASENIAQDKAIGKSAIAVLNREKESLIQKKSELDRQLAQDKRELQQIVLNLRQAKIIATEDGIIAKLNIRNSGQVVRLGEEIAQIVPSNNPLTLETTVSPAEIGKIKTGQRVQMQVSACPYPDYGTLGGIVSQISADTIKPQSLPEPAVLPTAKPPISAYKVTIKPNSLMLERGQKKCAIQLGMEGKTEIIAGEETFLWFLLRKAGLSISI